MTAVDLQVQLRASVGFLRESILTRQNEQREKDDFKAHDGREQAERKGIEGS